MTAMAVNDDNDVSSLGTRMSTSSSDGRFEQNTHQPYTSSQTGKDAVAPTPMASVRTHIINIMIINIININAMLRSSCCVGEEKQKF